MSPVPGGRTPGGRPATCPVPGPGPPCPGLPRSWVGMAAPVECADGGTGLVLLLALALLGAASVVLTAAYHVHVRRSDKRARAAMLRQLAGRHLLTSALRNAGDAKPVDDDVTVLRQLSEQQTVALVVTDIEGSTAMSNANPNAYFAVQSEHDRVARSLLHQHAGHEIHTQGALTQEPQGQLLAKGQPRTTPLTPNAVSAPTTTPRGQL